jgi:hypothetical protein
MTSDQRKALELAGLVATAARAVVGGSDITGWYHKPANIEHVGRLSQELRTALDAYDQHILNMSRNSTKP